MDSLADIPFHKILDFAPQGVLARLYGGEDRGERDMDWDVIENFPVHRDDHYFFLIVESGTGSLDIDFRRIQLRRRELYVVTPGQLHGNINARGCRGWVVLVSPDFIQRHDRDILGRNMFRVRPHSLSEDEFNSFRRVLQLLVAHSENGAEEPYFERILHSLTDLFVSFAVKSFQLSEKDVSDPDTRLRHIACEFKELVRNHCHIEKSVQFYARALNITSGYLNEVINKITGRPTSYWIQEEILLEAKRLLMVTTMTVKEIAYHLGYDNYSYFNRMFHAKVGVTPLDFRRNNRK